MKSERDVSVIIPTRNRSLLLGKCLTSFLKQTTLPREIIVVDNDSSDNTVRVVKHFQKRLPVIYLFDKRPGGPALSRNLGIKRAKGKIIAFLDDDCIAYKNWIENIWKAHKKGNEVIVQGHSFNFLANNSLSSKVYYYIVETWFQLLIASSKKRKTLEINFIDSRNFSAPATLIIKKNLLFDELVNWHEETDLGLKALEKDVEILYDPEIKVRHITQKKLLNLLRSTYKYGKARAQIYKKWLIREKRTKYLKDREEIIWKIKRDKFSQTVEKRVFEKLVEKKGSINPTFLKMGIKMAKCIRAIGFFVGYNFE